MTPKTWTEARATQGQHEDDYMAWQEIPADLKRIDHVIDRSEGRPQSEYWGYYDGNFIGVRSTNHACERMLDEYAYDLLSSDLIIPTTTLDGQCGDCAATLDSMGLCGCGAEERIDPEITANDVYPLTFTCEVCEQTKHEDHFTLSAQANTDATVCNDCVARPAPLTCICGQPAPILEPHGAFCAGCWEASDLWRLWKEDSTEFVAELRRQNCRLNEMAARLATYLNAKNGSALGCDSILAMWRQLLDDGDDPKPRFYVVAARQQVAA